MAKKEPKPEEIVTEEAPVTEETPVTKKLVTRSGEYTVYALSTDDGKSVLDLEKHLSPLGVKMKQVKDDKIYRLQFGDSTTSREVAMRRIALLQKAGIKTAHHLLS